MSDTTTKIISQLDFEEIKSNLSAFIANNSDFTDYNFEGSALSFLTDILAYNTHYNAVYLNMALNENFIDTAQTRSSVVSLAKNFGYTPRSKKSSLSSISFNILETDPLKADGNVIFLEKTNYFRAEIAGVSYIFSPVQTVSATSSGGIYTFTDVLLREGSYITVKYPVLGVSAEKFIINNFNIDLDSIGVTVQNSVSDIAVKNFSLISDITTLTPDSDIFYLFETTDRRYEISFGDGVLGSKLTAGNIVNLTYQTSSGADANGASSFVLANLIDGRFDYSKLLFFNVVVSYGGDAEESIDSIRINALQNFRTQGRAVTAEDYKFFIGKDYPLAQTISVWGGQDNVPPIYGKVFISFKPADGFFLSAAAKADIISIIKSKNIVSVIPEIIDPEYLFLEISSLVKFNPRVTLLTAAEIKAKVLAQIANYNRTTLTQFGTSFAYSKFIATIDATDASISDNLTTILMRKAFPVTLNKSLQYNIDFQNGIHPGSLESKGSFKAENDVSLSTPTEDLWIDDDENGKVRIYKYTGVNLNVKTIINPSAGTIDYEKGIVKLINFSPSQVSADGYLNLRAKPIDFSIGDISSYRNTIITILDTDVKVEIQVA